jgi:hypothetical protein
LDGKWAAAPELSNPFDKGRHAVRLTAGFQEPGINSEPFFREDYERGVAAYLLLTMLI